MIKDPKELNVLQRIFIKAIRVYQVSISPLLPPRCRFYPTCSEYALESFQRFGVVKGTVLTLKRLAHCHPWGSCGYDPVPDQCSTSSHKCNRNP